MLPKSVTDLSRSTSQMINVSVDMVRGLTWGETRDLVRFARRRLKEEKLQQAASSLTFTTIPGCVSVPKYANLAEGSMTDAFREYSPGLSCRLPTLVKSDNLTFTITPLKKLPK